MRPDKHKKRQHAAYAKKAGKKDSRNRAPPETNAGRTSTKEGLVNSGGEHMMRKDQTTDLETGAKPNNHGSSKDVLEQRISSEKKLSTDHSLPSFSRRKIESNWEQYEETHESDESVERRGADFTLLLNQTVGSDFRFKDEDSFDDDSIQVDIANMLSFNCIELAQKLQSIALPERLEISRSVFDVESLEILDQDAVTLSTMGYSHDSQRPQNADKSNTSAENPTDNYLDQELDDILTLTENGRTSGAQNKVESHSYQREFLDEASSELKCTSNEVKIHSPNDGSPAKHLECSEEDELDFLLSLDAPVIDAQNKHKDEPSMKREDRNPSPTTENLPICEKSVPVDSAPSVSSSEIATENLDDWLDSILED